MGARYALTWSQLHHPDAALTIVDMKYSRPGRSAHSGRSDPAQDRRVGNRKLALAMKPSAQSLTFHVRDHIEQQSINAPAVEQREDVRMLKFGGVSCCRFQGHHI